MKRYSVTLLLVVALVAIACAESLTSLAPFPCAQDGTCPDGFGCSDATECVPTCPAGETFCGGGCVTTASDPNNCGGCGNVSPSAICENGCALLSPVSTCAPWPLCGCSPSQNCFFDNADERWECGDAGTMVAGAPCIATTDCARGLVCIATDGGGGTCRAYCGATCPVGESCCSLTGIAADGGALPSGGMACLVETACP